MAKYIIIIIKKEHFSLLIGNFIKSKTYLNEKKKGQKKKRSVSLLVPVPRSLVRGKVLTFIFYFFPNYSR